MTCRRAYEIDIAAYLADPRAAEFADFRAHWPACAACAAEVRAWTELSARLAAGAAPAHPEPALLLRYEEAPNRLEPAQHAALRAHLAGCAACRDELTGLRTFDPRLALRQALESAERNQPTAARRLTLAEVLRGLFWQPAFAYAVAFAVAGPLIYLQVVQEGIDLRPQPRSESVAVTPAPGTSSLQPPSPAAAPAAPRAASPAPSAGLAATPEPSRVAPSAPPAKEKREIPAALGPAPRPKPAVEEPRSTGAGAAAPQAAPPPPREPASEPAPPPDESRAPEPEAAQKSLEGGPAGGLAQSDRRARSEGEPAGRGDVEPRRLEQLRALGYVVEAPGARLPLERDGGGEFVSVPLDPDAAENVVRIESPDGEKRRVERYAAGASIAQLRLAEGWLGAGRHRIVVRSDRGEREYYVER